MCHFVFVLNPRIDGRSDLESQHSGGRCDFTLVRSGRKMAVNHSEQ